MKKMTSVVLTGLVVFSTGAEARDRESLLASLSNISIGFEYLSLSFEPDGRGDSSDGNLAGVFAEATLTPRFLGLNLFFEPHVALAGGSDSEQISGGLRFGLSYLLNEAVVLSPYLAVDGYKFDLEDVGGGGRTYRHVGYGGGLRADVALSDRWSVRGEVTVQRNGFSEADIPIPDPMGGGNITLGLEDEWTVQAGVSTTWWLSERGLGLFAGYRYTSIGYGESNRNSLVVEEGQDVTGHSALAGFQLAF